MPRVLRNYQREDFSALLESLRAGEDYAEIENVLARPVQSLVDNEALTITSEEEWQRRRRTSMLDNRSYRYVVDQRSGIIHDKDCEMVKTIPDSAFDMIKTIDAESNICLKCRRDAYIRIAIGDDAKHLGIYRNFFKRAGASDGMIKELTLHNQAKLFMEEVNLLRLKVGEDRWKIKIDTDGKVTLYHNNYVVLADRSRYFNDGYHKQVIGGQNNFANAIGIINNYSWEKHLEAKEEKERETKVIYMQKWAEIMYSGKKGMHNRLLTYWIKIPKSPCSRGTGIDFCATFRV